MHSYISSFQLLLNTYFLVKSLLTVKLKPKIFSQGVLIVNNNLQGNVRKVGLARVARVGDPSIWDNFSPYKRGLSLFVHAGSRTYVFAQSLPVLFHCGSGEHFCFVCLVLMVDKSIVYSGGFQCYALFVCGLYYKVSFFI